VATIEMFRLVNSLVLTKRMLQIYKAKFGFINLMIFNVHVENISESLLKCK
jgi:hypothetical protein